MIQLSNKQCSLIFNEQEGGRLEQCYIDGLKILVDNKESPLSWGSYPMAPWVGRLKNGQLDFNNKRYNFPINMPPHAIHGTCFNKVWNIEQDLENRLEMSVELAPHWPFPGKAYQLIELQQDRLIFELSVYSYHDVFPASIGWHPWFRKQLEQGESLQLDFQASQKYQCDEEQIPTGHLEALTQKPWDDCFVGLMSEPTLYWPEALILTISSDCDHWVVYDFPEHATCVEPQTAPANSINTQQAFLITPEKPLKKQMTWKWAQPS